MDYDQSLDYVGLGNIFEKVKLVIDGEERIFYKYFGSAVCTVYNFPSGVKYIVLNGELAGRIIGKGESDYLIGDYKTFLDLGRKNNNNFNLKQFKESYIRDKEEIYVLNDNKDTLVALEDEELIRKIKDSSSKYDDKLLVKDTDISKMYTSIKKTIISQDEQIMQILTSLFKNQKVINSSLSLDLISKLKENLIVYGSTGTGKTEILKRIASIYKVPIVIEDASSLSETGYVGRSVTDMLEDLYLASGKDIELAQKGILVIDEFDKLAEKETNREHVSRNGVQRSLLKLLDGSKFYFGDKVFDTSKLSVVALGAFTGITENDDYSKVSSTDFVKYGIMRELMGRFSKLVYMNPLSKDDIKKILLESDFSPLNTYKQLFEMMNIEFSYDDDFVDYLAERAIKLNSGARSLKTVFDDIISSAMFKIFAGDYSSIQLTTRSINSDNLYILKPKKN